MRTFNDRLILSPSDLIRFQACAHASALDRRYALGEPLTPAEDEAETALIQKKGFDHEGAYLSRFATAEVFAIKRGTPFGEAKEQTIAAMRAGISIVYQGALETGAWQGWSDFLERIDRPSDLGAFSYVVADTKLKRHAEPKHALQLALYSRAVTEIQGAEPAYAYVVIGTGERVSVPLADVSAYTARLAGRLEAFVAAPQPTTPEPVEYCGMCRWRKLCDAEYDATDSLVRVAGITRSQRQRFTAAGVDTLEKLAHEDGPVCGMTAETFEKLRIQASLQSRRRRFGKPAIILKDPEPGRGFARLPTSARGDLFFDMEGDPLIVGGREYLFGVFSEQDQFRAWWAHDDAAERDATRAVLEYFLDRLTADPAAHIYHYNHYEVTALKRLTQRHGVGERILDELLRQHRFVDLYRIVQQGLYASEPGYSLKNLEVFFRDKRDGAVTTAVDSIVAYETWLEHGDQGILDDIERYNEIDCRSTQDLRNWLMSSNYALYGDLSARVMSVLAEHAPRIEVYSIDESFLDLHGLAVSDLTAWCQDLRQTVLDWTGIPVSIGIGPSKTLAKVANHLAKKSATGVCDLATDPCVIEVALKATPAGDVWGVGRQWAKRCAEAGIVTAWDLRHAPQAWVRQQMGAVGLRTVLELSGTAVHRLEDNPEDRQSCCCSRTFGEATRSRSDVQDAVVLFAQRAAEKLRRDELVAAAVQTFIMTDRFGSGAQRSAALTIPLSLPTFDSRSIICSAVRAFTQCWKDGFAYRKAGVLLLDLTRPQDAPRDLFTPLPNPRHAALMQTIDAANARFGSGAIRFGLPAPQAAWGMRQRHRSPSYTTNWDDVPKVRIG